MDYFQDDINEESSRSAGTSGRSIRNITVPSRSRSGRRTSGDNGSRKNTGSGTGGKKTGIWLIAIISVVALGGIAYFAFRETTVTVVPRTHTVVFDEAVSYTAYPEGESVPTGAIIYSLVSKTFEESKPVDADSEEKVNERANGTLTVVNNYSESELRLIKNTRFETPAGLVYRIRDSVVVPGKTANAPGVLEVTVYADEPGGKYNIGPVSKFTLPGLRTSAPEMFSDVYARSDSPMTGGFSGTRPVVSTSVLDNVRAELRVALEEKARAAIAELNNESSFVFAELADISYESVAPQFTEDGSTVVKERAILRAPSFGHTSFAHAIATATSANAGEGEVTIPDTSTFTIKLLDTENKVKIGEDPIDFALSGRARFVWNVDAIKLAQSLAGKDKDAFEQIVSGFPGVEQADAHIRPFWRSSFPSDPGSIAISIQDNKE